MTAGNLYDKYGTRNPVGRLLMRGFLAAVTELYTQAAPETVLEVGCGEGRLAQHLLSSAPRPKRFVASDEDLGALDEGLDAIIEVERASVLSLPFADRSFDLVLCCEVLEHLHDPAKGLREIARVASRFVIVSTPREPLWRGLNIARGAYLRSLGNTPGHIQHFSRRGLETFVATHLRLIERRTPLPWTVLLATPAAPDSPPGCQRRVA